MLAEDAKRRGKKELVKKTFKTNTGKIALEHDDEIMQLETEAMKRVMQRRSEPRLNSGRRVDDLKRRPTQ